MDKHLKKTASALILCLALVTACTPQPQNSPAPTPVRVTPASATQTPAPVAAMAADYFAFKADERRTYKGTGNEYASNTTVVDFLKDGVVQVRQDNGGTVAVCVYALADVAMKKVYMRNETYFKYDFTSMSNTDEVLIKEPIQTGTAWTLKDGSLRTITAVDKQVTTPSGTYRALEVTTTGRDSTRKDYYAGDIGLIKSESTSGGDTITSELEKIEIGVSGKNTVRFYYPDFNQQKAVYDDREIETSTNEDVLNKLELGLKTVPFGSGLSTTLSNAAKVLSVSLDESKGIVTVDFSQELISGMNAGSAMEGLVIKSITNTFGHYYQMDKVIIDVKGELYESGHIALQAGEYFTVSDAGTAAYQAP